MDDSIDPVRSVLLLLAASAGIASALVGASCSSFDDVEEPALDSSTPDTTIASGNDSGPVDAGGGDPGSCGPLGKRVGYFAHFPSAAGAEIYSLAAEPTGDVWISGYSSDVDLGAGSKATGAFLVKLDGATKTSGLVSIASPSGSLVRGRGVVVDGTRRYWSVFHENAIVYRDAGYAPTTDGGFSSLLVAFNPDNAEPLTGSGVFGNELAPVAGDGVFVGGHFVGEVTAGPSKTDGGPFGGTQLFAARLFSGAAALTRTIGPGDRIVRSASTDGQGRVHLTGRFTQQTPYGDGGPAQDSDAYLAVYLPNLAFDHFARFGGLGNQEGRAIVGMLDGHSIVAGQFEGALEGPQGSSLGQPFGKLDMFIARIGLNGNLVWSVLGGGPEDDIPVAMVRDPVADRIIVLGRTASSKVKLGALELTNPRPGIANTFVGILSPTGEPLGLWTPTGGQGPTAMTVDATGRVYIAGSFGGEMTVGSITRTATSTSDLFVIRCDP